MVRTCPISGKQIYYSQRIALVHMNLLRSTTDANHDAENDADLNVYFCSSCGGWHIGHRNTIDQLQYQMMNVVTDIVEGFASC
jgi:hypothetical protein